MDDILKTNLNHQTNTTTAATNRRLQPSSSQHLQPITTTPTTNNKHIATKTTTTTRAAAEEESGRERLKRHRVEMAGRVWIPDIWGQEDLLKDWIDCSVFDSSLGNNTIISARTALVQEAGRSTLRIENRC